MIIKLNDYWLLIAQSYGLFITLRLYVSSKGFPAIQEVCLTAHAAKALFFNASTPWFFKAPLIDTLFSMTICSSLYEAKV